MIKKIRAQHISIDLPNETGPVWIRAVIQTIFKNKSDYKTVQMVDRTGFLHREVNQIATQMTTITDPVTGQTIQVSGAAAAILIRKFITQWIVDDFGGEINEFGDIIFPEE